jgi:hypothetical protein
MKPGIVIPLLSVVALPFFPASLDGATAQESAVATKTPPPPNSDRPAIRERIAQLGSDDPATREAAMKSLAAEGEAARSALQQARKSNDAETRFSAEQLLDRLDQESEARKRAMQSVGGLLRESDPPPSDDPATDRRRALRVMPGLFDDGKLRELHDRMHARARSLFDGEDPFAPFFRFDAGSSFSRVVDHDGRREKLEVKVDADGRAKAVVERDGKVETFEADSLDQLRALKPELFEGFGELHFGLRGPDVGRAAPDRAAPDRAAPRRAVRPPPAVNPQRARLERADDVRETPREVAPPAAAAEGPRLGIRVEPIDAALAEHLELEAGVGLKVIEVERDGAAAGIGVRRNDLVIEVNGRTIRGVADVQAALKGTQPIEADLVVIRKGRRIEL